MSDERITVDEALISTDVDRLIKIISIRRRADIRELQEETGLDRKSIEKWLHVLEDEGYIQIDYRITNMVVQWTGPDGETNVGESREHFSHQSRSSPPAPRYSEPAPPTFHSPNPNYTPSPSVSIPLVKKEPLPIIRKDVPEPPLVTKPPVPGTDDASSGISPSSNASSNSAETNSTPDDSSPFQDEIPPLDFEPPVEMPPPESSEIKESILKALREADSTFSTETTDAEVPNEAVPEEEKIQLRRGIRGERKAEPPEEEPEISIQQKRTLPSLSELKEEAERGEETEPPWTRKRVPRESVKIRLPEPALRLPGEARAAISSYMGEINRQKQEIDRLKEDKERIYREGYATLESKMGSDIATLSERILEKETRILELKEHLVDLPDRVEEIEKLSGKADRIRREGRKNLESIRQRINVFLSELEKTETSLQQRVEGSRRMLGEGKQKSEELAHLQGQLENRAEELNGRIMQTQTEIQQLDGKIQGMLGDLGNFQRIKAEILQVSEHVTSAVEKKEGEMDDLVRALEEVRKIGQWMREYVEDYEVKIEEMDEYVAQTEEELNKVREAAEAGYLQRYLQELEGLTQNYEGELGDLMETEKDIDKKLERARERLKTLLLDSQATVRRLARSDAGGAESFRTLADRAKDHAQEKKRRLEEKDREYEQLIEDVKQVKASRKRKGEDKKKGKKK